MAESRRGDLSVWRSIQSPPGGTCVNVSTVTQGLNLKALKKKILWNNCNGVRRMCPAATKWRAFPRQKIPSRNRIQIAFRCARFFFSLKRICRSITLVSRRNSFNVTRHYSHFSSIQLLETGTLKLEFWVICGRMIRRIESESKDFW